MFSLPHSLFPILSSMFSLAHRRSHANKTRSTDHNNSVPTLPARRLTHRHVQPELLHCTTSLMFSYPRFSFVSPYSCRLLHYSTTPLLHYSTTPLFHYSTIPLFYYFYDTVFPTNYFRSTIPMDLFQWNYSNIPYTRCSSTPSHPYSKIFRYYLLQRVYLTINRK